MSSQDQAVTAIATGAQGRTIGQECFKKCCQTRPRRSLIRVALTMQGKISTGMVNVAAIAPAQAPRSRCSGVLHTIKVSNCMKVLYVIICHYNNTHSIKPLLKKEFSMRTTEDPTRPTWAWWRCVFSVPRLSGFRKLQTARNHTRDVNTLFHSNNTDCQQCYKMPPYVRI